MNDTLEHTAGRIAERGREELVARLRPAFKQAASAHAEDLELSDEQIEQMVQRAADRADGVQWRRALASVATEELGIGLGEALGHPAVARAQAIVGAPSYAESLAKLASEREGPPGADHDEGDAGAEAQIAAEPEPEGVQEPDRVQEPEGVQELGELTPDAEDKRSVVRVAAVHLGGIANLAAEEGGLELRLSDGGFDLWSGEGEVLGHLTWREIHGLEVAAARGVRRRRRREAQLVVRTGQGEASFQVPALTPEELRERLAPLLERHQRR